MCPVINPIGESRGVSYGAFVTTAVGRARSKNRVLPCAIVASATVMSVANTPTGEAATSADAPQAMLFTDDVLNCIEFLKFNHEEGKRVPTTNTSHALQAIFAMISRPPPTALPYNV